MTRSIRLAAFVAALTCLPATALAQNAVLYGLVDASGSNVKPVGASKDRWQLDNGNMALSFLGFRGSEDLGGGLRAVWKLESYVRVDNGTSGRFDGDAYWAREASVGLSGAFGTTVIGRNPSPLWAAVVNFNPFGESVGFSPSRRQTFATVLGDTRWNNSVSYTNNPTDALRASVAYNADETGVGGGHNVGASLSYITGPFAATLVAERIRNSAQALPAGFHQQIVFQGGATYDFKFLRVYGQAARVKTEATTDARTTLYQLGAAVPFGTSLVLAAYGHSRTKPSGLASATDKQGSLAYDYFLSKNTDIYLAALYEKLTNVSSGRSFAGGVRHRF